MQYIALCGLLPCISNNDVGETWTTPEANSILHLIVVVLRASERFRNFRPPVPLPVKLVSVLVLPNTLSCSSVSFRYHWMSVTGSLVGVVAKHMKDSELPPGRPIDSGGLTNTV